MLQQEEVGIAVGQYQGGGQGENAPPDSEVDQLEPIAMDVDVMDVEVDSSFEDDPEAPETLLPSDKLPLLFFFDVETTGLVVYEDVIIDIAAKVVDITQSAVSQPMYHSLLRTSKTIPKKGRKLTQVNE